MADEDLQLSELDEEEKADSPPSTELGESDLVNAEAIEIPEIPRNAQDLEAVYDIPVQVSAVLGRSTMEVQELLKLGKGAVVELDRRSARPLTFL